MYSNIYWHLQVTVLNAVAIIIGIILQRPVEVPTTNFKGDSIRAVVEHWTLGGGSIDYK